MRKFVKTAWYLLLLVGIGFSLGVILLFPDSFPVVSKIYFTSVYIAGLWVISYQLSKE